MTQEEKQLLLKDLCARLPYGVKVKFAGYSGRKDCILNSQHLSSTYAIEYLRLRPYLRPMSSMTEEEFGFLQEHLPYDFTRIYSSKFDLINDIHLGNSISIDDIAFLLDCLNKWHFDYRGLIAMGLALEAQEGMYSI